MSSLLIGDNEQNPLSIIRLIDGKEAIEQFSKIDKFLTNMSKFDLQSRLQTSEEVDIKQYINFIIQQILPWEQKYIKIFSEIVNDLNRKSLDILKICSLPKEVLVILTNGEDEAGAAYCRNLNVIVLPISKLQASTDIDVIDLTNTNLKSKDTKLDFASEKVQVNNWQTIFPHELFHIISRNNLNLRDKLYECIGYYPIPDGKCANVPNDLTDLKITNPDAPVAKHYIKLRANISDKELCLAPILVASQSYSPGKYKSFFDYLLTRFAVLDENNWQVTKLIHYSDVQGFYDKIGKNTNYIIHPEEILADNFVFLINHQTDTPSPQILESMERIFKS